MNTTAYSEVKYYNRDDFSRTDVVYFAKVYGVFSYKKYVKSKKGQEKNKGKRDGDWEPMPIKMSKGLLITHTHTHTHACTH